MKLPVPYLLRLLLVPGGAGAELTAQLHMKLHPRQSNPQETVLVISCSSKPRPPQLCLLVQSLITHLHALHPCTAGKAKHCQDGIEMSQATAELSTARWSLLPPGRTTFLSCSTDTRDSSNPGTKLLSLNPSKLECQLIMEQHDVMPTREIVSLKQLHWTSKRNCTDAFGDTQQKQQKCILMHKTI